MNVFMQGFLDNDSYFGKFMTKLGIIIGANLMFILFSLPFFTLGAALAALYYVMLRTLRSEDAVNPFKEFWIGFKTNFRQATILWLIFVAVMAFLSVDLQICRQAGGVFNVLVYAIYAIGAVVLALFFFIMPVMAAFEAKLTDLPKHAFYFLMKKPWKSIVILFFDIFPLVLTYTDLRMLPLYAFIWVMCGFGLQAMLASTLLLPEFKVFLPQEDEDDGYPIDPAADEEQILAEMRKLDGL